MVESGGVVDVVGAVDVVFAVEVVVAAVVLVVGSVAARTLVVGPVLGSVAEIFVAEIGEVGPFRSAEALCSWAGLTPRHRESDTKVTRGGISKMGSRLVRWAAPEAVSAYKGGPVLREDFHRIAERRGRNKARVAVARKLLTLVYYGLRDGEIRCLRDNAAVAA